MILSHTGEKVFRHRTVSHQITKSRETQTSATGTPNVDIDTITLEDDASVDPVDATVLESPLQHGRNIPGVVEFDLDPRVADRHDRLPLRS